MYFFQNAIRGETSVVGHRHAKANNPLVPNYDPSTPYTFINNLGQNNLYGNSMYQTFPTSEISFLSNDNVKSFHLDATTKSNDCGYILEVDLQYPKYLLDAQSHYLLVIINRQTLSQRTIITEPIQQNKICTLLWKLAVLCITWTPTNQNPSHFKIPAECMDETIHWL